MPTLGLDPPHALHRSIVPSFHQARRRQTRGAVSYRSRPPWRHVLAGRRQTCKQLSFATQALAETSLGVKAASAVCLPFVSQQHRSNETDTPQNLILDWPVSFLASIAVPASNRFPQSGQQRKIAISPTLSEKHTTPITTSLGDSGARCRWLPPAVYRYPLWMLQLSISSRSFLDTRRRACLDVPP